MFACLKAEAIINTRIIDDDYPANHIAFATHTEVFESSGALPF
jgi:hypothetical protein